MTGEGRLPADAAIELVAVATEIGPEVDFFVDAGFRLDAVFPADDPSTAVLSRAGAVVRVVRGEVDRPLRLLACLDGATPSVRRSPGGSTIEVVAGAEPDPVVPAGVPALVITRPGEGSWVTGRAGMRYRELLPDRWGGRFIASRISIPDGGPVPDYVHSHQVRFQLIAVTAGWVEVVYEDQGPPFVMHPGDAVLQPPGIRHRVLRASPGLEVVEIGCPAEHVTLVDHELALPTPTVRPDRDFGGQRFVRSVLDATAPEPWLVDGFCARDTGIGRASGGLVGARIVEPAGRSAGGPVHTSRFFTLFVVLAGAIGFELDGATEPLSAGAAVAFPASTTVGLLDPSPDLRLLEVTEPA